MTRGITKKAQRFCSTQTKPIYEHLLQLLNNPSKKLWNSPKNKLLTYWLQLSKKYNILPIASSDSIWLLKHKGEVSFDSYEALPVLLKTL